MSIRALALALLLPWWSADAVVTEVEIRPGVITLAVGDTATVTCVPRHGNTVVDNRCGWQVGSKLIATTVGTALPQSLRLRGLKDGNTFLVATVSNLRDTAQVVVGSLPGGNVTAIQVLPDTATLKVGTTQQFDAPGVSPTWSATGGTISAAGLYLAGQQAGAHRVIGRLANGTADTSWLTVVDTTVTVQPHTLALNGAAARGTLQGHARDYFTGPIAGVTWAWTVVNTSVVAAIASTASAVTVVPVGNGTTYVRGAVGADKDSALITVTGIAGADSASPPVGKFVATAANGGSSGNPGTYAAPWTLAHAASGPASLAAGDTVWIKPGVYTGTYTFVENVGSGSSNVCYKNMPDLAPDPDPRGSHVEIEGNISVSGGADHICLWGLEVDDPTPASHDIEGVSVQAPDVKLIHMVVHDAAKSGIGHYQQGTTGEVYGSIVYNNGIHENLDHGIYTTEDISTGKLIKDNLLFNNLAYGIHGYSSGGSQYTNNLRVIGNCAVNNGTIATTYSERADILIATAGTTMQDIVVDTNGTFRSNVSHNTADIGWGFGPGGNNLTYRGNYLVGTVTNLGRWTSVTQSGNTNITTYPGSGVVMAVRPSVYDPNRGNICVYNWPNTSTNIAVNISPVVGIGQDWVVYHAFNYWGSPVASGTNYAGGTVNIPVSNSPAPPALQGRTYTTAPNPGPRYSMFVIFAK